MESLLRVLIVEDSPDDASMLSRALQQGGYEIVSTRVDTITAMRQALQREEWDLILSDHSMPRFTSAKALGLLKELSLDIPFIIVSGTIGEMQVVAALKAGAHDFIEKGDLTRLLPSVERELREVRVRREHRDAEEARRNAESKYRLLFEESPDGVMIVDPRTSRIVEGNTALKTMLGYSTPELEVLTIADIEASGPGHKGNKHVTKTLRDRSDDFETTLHTKSGQLLDVIIRIRSIVIGGTSRLHCIVRDITERKRAIRALHESEERYRQYFNEDLTGYFNSTMDGRILVCNPSFIRIFGFQSLQDAVGTNTHSLYPDRKDRETLIQLIRKQKKLEYYEMEMRRRDGQPVHIVATIFGQFGMGDELIGLKGYIFDNTERKRLEGELLQSQKMEAVGQLASGIAHDFNNVMGVVLTASHLLSIKFSDPEILRYAKMIEEATLRGSAIAKQLLQFSRAEAAKLAPVSLTQTVLEAKKFLDHSLPKTIVVDLDVNVDHGLVMADAGQIHQMILNLCINARDAILERTDRQSTGKILISLRPVTGGFIEEKYGWKSADNYILLSVADDGVGIPEDIKRRIFDPFFTTKGIGKGTGLGLSIVHGVVKAHNAMIDVESTEGKGTTFLVYFPAITHHALIDQPHQAHQSRGNGESILIIEDEKLLRELLKEFLLGAGYRVLEAGDGEEGIEVYRTHMSEIQLVLSDIGLPKLGGEQVMEVIRKENPQAKVIFCTGFIEEQTKARLLDSGVLDILHKPYKVPEVLSAVRKAIDLDTKSTP